MLKYINFTDGDILREIVKLEPASNPIYSAADDLAFGILFSDIFKRIVCYVPKMKSWLVYNGSSWKKEEETTINEYAARFSRQLQHYSVDLPSPGGSRTHFQIAVGRLGDRRARLRFVGDASDRLSVDMNIFDSEKHFFNVQNTVINLKKYDPETGIFETIPHDPEQHFIKIARAAYNPEARCPRFKKFMNEILENDQEMISFVQELFGISLLGYNPEDSMTLLLGKNGRNGKSCLLETLRNVFGGSDVFSSYATNMNPETLALKRFHDGSKPAGDLARLKGIRLLISSEPAKGMIFDTALLKNLTGRDRIVARHVHEKEIEFIPEFSLFMAANDLPGINDDIVFSTGRIRVIEFNKSFSPNEQDKNLRQKLNTKEELSGILNWLLEGLGRYIKNGYRLTVPEKVKESTKEYRKQSDKLGLFLEECTEQADESISLKEFYICYRAWCRTSGYLPESKRIIKEALIRRKLFAASEYIPDRNMTLHNIVPGLRLTSEARGMYLKEIRNPIE